jgi:hypothetical protein
MKNILPLLVLTGNICIYSQSFNVPLQYEQRLQNINEEANYLYELQQQGVGLEGFEGEIISIASIGNIIENFIPNFTTIREKAIFLNEVGFSYYENKKYRIACHFFSYAFHIDNTYKYSAYNYACSVALLNLETWGNSVPVGSRYGSVVEIYLNKAINIDQNYRTKMREDFDLKYYRHEPWFIILSGADINTRAGILDLLLNTEVWYGPKPGVYPQSPELYFQQDGTVIIKRFYMREDEFGWTTSQERYTVYEGYFTYQDNNGSYRGIIEKRYGKYCLYIVDRFENSSYFTTEVDYSA